MVIFEHAERPVVWRQKSGRTIDADGLTAALIETASTGRAMRLNEEGILPRILRMKIIGSRVRALKHHGYRLHTSVSHGALLAWCTKCELPPDSQPKR